MGCYEKKETKKLERERERERDRDIEKEKIKMLTIINFTIKVLQINVAK